MTASTAQNANPPDAYALLRATEPYIEAGRLQYAEPELTDLGNADRLIRRHGQDLLFIYPWKTWMTWNGQAWAKDDTGAVHRLAAETVRDILREAHAEKDPGRSKDLAGHWRKSQNRTRLDAMIALAQSLVPARPDDFDKDPMLLNVQNGTLDLSTGKLLRLIRAHRITKQAGAAFDPKASCPAYMDFMLEIMDGRPELVEYLQRVLGYCLTGDTSGQCFFLFHGLGANGKSTLIEVWRELLGDYARHAEFGTFLSRPDSGGASNDLAALRGARLVTAAEANAGKSLNESLIKQLTGGEPITARFLYAEYFSFRPEFKLILAANHKPRIRNVDNGIWRRVRLVPFDVQIPEERQDKRLKEKLLAELPGILNWALYGFYAWREGGLAEPEPVKVATGEYRDESDVLAPFLETCCVLENRARVTVADLKSAYTEHCKRDGLEPVPNLKALLEQRGLRQRKNRAERFWEGIRLANG